MADCCVGKNSVPKIFASAFKRLGISNWESLRGHALRGIFGTKMANASNVNLKQGLSAMRHKSVAAFLSYQKRGKESRENALAAALALPEDYGVASLPSKGSLSDYCEETPNLLPGKALISPSPLKRLKTAPLFASPSSSDYFADEKNTKLSSYTQLQVDGLKSDLIRYQKVQCLNPYAKTNTYRPMFGNYEDSPLKRQPSSRKLELLHMRRRVKELEHRELMRSFPYKSPWDESSTLYRDSIEMDFLARKFGWNVRR